MVKRHEKTPYHILHGRKPNIKYFHVFGCTCYVLNDKDHLGKFSRKADEPKFIGYSLTSKAYKGFLINSKTIVESINVSFDDSFQATSAQLSSRLKLNDIHPTRANDVLHLLDEMYDDDIPPEDPLRTSEAETSEGPTGLPLSGPLNDSHSCSVSGPHVEGNISVSTGSVNDQSPDQSPSSEPPYEVPTSNPAQENISDIPSQDQQPSAQSINVPVHQEEGNSNDQLHRVTKWTRSHPLSQIIGDPSDTVKTRALANTCLFTCIVSMIEPKKVSEALEDPFWIDAMQDELLLFERN
jgi:hypothetical protein